MLENVSTPTGGLLLFADKKDGYTSNSQVAFWLLVNETSGDQLSLSFGDGQRHLVNHSALTPRVDLPAWIDRHVVRQFQFHGVVSHTYRRPGLYDVCMLTNDSLGNAMELTRTSIVIGFEEIKLSDLKVTTCVNNDGIGTILITSRRRLCDVVAEWSHNRQLFVDLVSFRDGPLPVWATVDTDDNGMVYAATLTWRDAVTNGRKQFNIGLTGRIFNTTYKFAETRVVDLRPVAVELDVGARRVSDKREAVLRIASRHELESLHVMVVVADNVWSKYVELRSRTDNDSIMYEAEMTLKMTLPVPERITATFTGSKDNVCFVISNTTDVVDHTETGNTDFEVFSHVDDAGNAAVVIMAGTRVNNVIISWGLTEPLLGSTKVDLVADEKPPFWLTTDLSGYYKKTLTYKFDGPVPDSSLLTIYEQENKEFAQVKTIHWNRRSDDEPASPQPTLLLPSTSSNVGGVLTSDCDAPPPDFDSSSTQTQPEMRTRGQVDSNVYVTTHTDDGGTVTLEFYARHPIRDMIVDWDMPGTASRRVLDITEPAADVDGYYTAEIRRSFHSTPPNVTQLRMTGRVEGFAFNITKRLDHSREPRSSGFVAMVPVVPAPQDGFAAENRTTFRVSARNHYSTQSDVTIPVEVTSHDEHLKEVLVVDVTCSVRRDGERRASAEATDNEVDVIDNCTVAPDGPNGSLVLSIPSNKFSPGRYSVVIHVIFCNYSV